MKVIRSSAIRQKEDAMSWMQGQMRSTYVNGRLLYLWENPELPFGCRPEDMELYATNGCWIHLFNALVLDALGETGPQSVTMKS